MGCTVVGRRVCPCFQEIATEIFKGNGASYLQLAFKQLGDGGGRIIYTERG